MPKPPPPLTRFADYPSRPRPDRSLWIMGAPVISTGHIPRSDADLLEELHDQHPLLFPADTESGYLLNIGEWTQDDRFSPELNRICRDLDLRNWHYVRFDGAGDHFNDLPTFEW